MADRPNILLMMCDQLCARVLGCYGGPVPTPNIDRLASEGVLFTDATCPTPFCSPTRASIITGQYPHTHGIVCNCMRVDYPEHGAPPTEEGIHASDVTTEGLLHAAGYQTHHYGKWHLSDDDPVPYYPDMYGEHLDYAPEMAGVFDQVRTRPRDTWMDWYGWALPVEVSPPMREAVAAAADRVEGKWWHEFITRMGRLELPLDQVFDVRVADRTTDRLQQLGPEPFMITCSFNYPHDPNVLPRPYYEMFDPDAIELEPNHGVYESLFEGCWACEIPGLLGEAALREFLRIYYGAVKLVDDQVGRVLAALDATGRAGDTIVIFTADHGDMAGGHGMVWKSTSAFYDELVRVPLLVRYPGRFASGPTSLAASLTDLMPTLLELAEHPIPEGVQGRSLASYLSGGRDPAEAYPYTFSERIPANPEHTRRVAPGTRGHFMVRGRGWKYVTYGNGEQFLYDLASDPGEVNNLAGDPSCQDRRAELRGELDTWLAATGWQGGR